MDSFPETYVDPNYDSAPSIPKVKRNCLPARSRRNCSLFQGFAQDRSNKLAACQLPMRSKERTGKIDSAARTGGRNLRPVGGGGGDTAYERDGDARRLASGCKFRILVSLRVFWGKRHHI